MNRRDVVLFLSIVAVALVLRLVFILQMSASPLFNYPTMDELYHVKWAEAILAGEPFVDGPYFRAPLYPAFMAAVWKIFGEGYFVLRAVQAVLGALSCGILFLIGRDLFSRSTGALAGFAAASYWVFLYFDAELLLPSLVVFLNLVLIYVLLWAGRAPSAWRFAASGLVLGVSALARPNILLFAPAVACWILVLGRATPGTRTMSRSVVLGLALCFGIGCALPVLPVTLRNYVIGDDLVLLSSEAGVTYYVGNNPRADGFTARLPGGPSQWWFGHDKTRARAEEAVGRTLKPSEVSQYYFRRALRWAVANPADFAAHQIRKLVYFWTRFEIPNNKCIGFLSGQFTPAVRFLPLGFAVVGPLSILGLVLCARRPRATFPLWGYVLVYMASVVMFLCNARFRMPVMAPLILLASHAALWLVAAARRRDGSRLVRAAGVLLLGALLVTATTDKEDDKCEVRSRFHLANAYIAKGEFAPAAEHYRATLDLRPDFADVRRRYARSLAELGEIDLAIAEYRAVLERYPQPARLAPASLLVSVHRDLAVLMKQSGDFERAREHAVQAEALEGRAKSADDRRDRS